MVISGGKKLSELRTTDILAAIVGNGVRTNNSARTSRQSKSFEGFVRFVVFIIILS
jgi:hypothetical protein